MPNKYDGPMFSNSDIHNAKKAMKFTIKLMESSNTLTMKERAEMIKAINKLATITKLFSYNHTNMKAEKIHQTWYTNSDDEPI